MNNYPIQNLINEVEAEIEAEGTESIQMQYIDFNPALFFSGNQCFITTKIREKTQEGKIIAVPYVITSSKEKFILNDEFYTKFGFFKVKQPEIEGRWSSKSIENYLRGTSIEDGIVDSLISGLKDYFEFADEEVYLVVAYYILSTYLFHLFNAFPYLSITGDRGCGKTKLLTFISLSSFNGELFSSSSTAASIKRLIHDNSCTCCVDEVENLSRANDDDTKNIRAMYNMGYKKGSNILISEANGKSGQWKSKRLDVYSPKVFAGIKGLEETLSSRCIHIVMLRTANNEVANREIVLTDAKWIGLRDMCYLFVMKYWKDIQDAYINLDRTGFIGRDWEVWSPLLALAEVINPEDRELLNSYALETIGNRFDDLQELPTPNILKAFKEYFEQNGRQSATLNIEQIKNVLTDYDPEYFDWIFDSKKKTGRWIGNELRKAGLIKGRAGLQRILGKDKPVRVYQIRKDVVDERFKAYS